MRFYLNFGAARLERWNEAMFGPAAPLVASARCPLERRARYHIAMWGMGPSSFAVFSSISISLP
ncbi:MAG: hypothetical protein ACTHKH_21775 [Trinickia sp.]